MKKIKLLSSAVLFMLVVMMSCGDSDPKENPDDGGSGGGNTNPSLIEGTVKASNLGIKDIVVTDGYNFTKTGAEGKFSLEINSKATHIYISSPAGYTVPVEQSVPQFYKEITASVKNNGAHFELFKMDKSDDKHYFVAVGDPQVRNSGEIALLKPILEYLKKDIEKSKLDPVHLMVTGDIVFDTPNMHTESKQAFSNVQQPVYYAIGNHDHIKNTGSTASVEYDKVSEKTYREHYGPTYYSFNRGKVHYIVFDNILYEGGPDTKYSVEITKEQLDWIKKDLEYVSKDKVVVLMSHSPTKSRYKAYYGNSPELFSLLTGYKEAHIITGHTHYNSVMADNTNVTDHIIGAVCGGWWEGPVCPDGVYLGYKIFEIDGTNVKWKYRAYEYPEDQFSVFVPQEWNDPNMLSNTLIVNVWDWDVNWSVMWSEDGDEYKVLPRSIEKIYDPIAYEYFGATDNAVFPVGRGWINASLTDHMFVAEPKLTTQKVSIKVTNPFGEEFVKELIIRK